MRLQNTEDEGGLWPGPSHSLCMAALRCLLENGAAPRLQVKTLPVLGDQLCSNYTRSQLLEASQHELKSMGDNPKTKASKQTQRLESARSPSRGHGFGSHHPRVHMDAPICL